MARFTVLLYSEKEEGGYSALIPVLGLATQGNTIDEALAMAQEITELQVRWLAAHNEPILEEEEPPIVASVEVDVPVAAPG
jgi:predicted RNase H-like HicB family nuclease